MSIEFFWTLLTSVGRLPVFLQVSAQSEDTQGDIDQNLHALLSLCFLMKLSLSGSTSQVNNKNIFIIYLFIFIILNITWCKKICNKFINDEKNVVLKYWVY